MATDSKQQSGVGNPGASHGGRLAARALASRGISHLFTLSGGHLFSLYDGCKEEGIEVVDVRHEQAAAFAAEGWAKATRTPGVCALTAGPGVTNGVSAIAGAQFNGSPIAVLGGRAPEMTWGTGRLQEIDHLPVVSPLTKSAETVKQVEEIPAATARAVDLAAAAPTGPTFLDYPLDVVFAEAEVAVPDPVVAPDPEPAPGVEEAAELLAKAERPAIMAGTGLYWSRGEAALAELAERVGIPVFLNGMGRGCLPADHELAFSRARGAGLGGCDVAVVIGVPLDFRLGFGASIAEDAKLIRIDAEANRLERNRAADVDLVGDVAATVAALAEAAGDAGADRDRTSAWISQLRSTEEEKRAGEQDDFGDDRSPLHPMRLYKELAGVLDRDAIVIGDGGDFVSYAGRVIETYEPGCWMDPGPFGCLGAGPGQALGAACAHPDRQICVLLGDGAFGFSGMEWDTLARHGKPVVGVVGNNGIWALEKHPMEFLYGYSLAADLRPETPYEQVAESLGCHSELVRSPEQLRPALERAFSCGGPALVNVLTDPEVVYPRKAVLA
ncbi:MAG TPA: acetolactate synthase [Solirubrobacterales bacterium]|nr:acetolactate synthase [Solirubrobacterales bacterium]